MSLENGRPKNGQRLHDPAGREAHDLQRFFPLVNSVARRTLRGELAAFDYGDAVATGLLALVKSDRRIGADERGFVTYASQRVRGAILDAMRDLGYAGPSNVSLSSGGARDDNGHGSPFDIPDGSRYSSPEWVADRRESVRELREAIKLLCLRERQVLVFRYWREETTRSVAERLGISPARVSQLEKRARQRLRVLLADGNDRGECSLVRRLGTERLRAATS